jgi:drug/metabolite transporter (DMT)-like permease
MRAQIFPPLESAPRITAKLQEPARLGGRFADRFNSLFLLCVLGSLWGGSYSLVTFVMQTIPPITLTAFRVLLAAVVITLYARSIGQSLPRDPITLRWFLLQGAINPGIAWVLISWGQQVTGGGVAAIINTMSPMFAVILTMLWTKHEEVSALSIGGILLGFVGVVAIIGPSVFAGSSDEILATGAILLGTLGFAVSAVIGGQLLQRFSPTIIAAGALWGASAVLVPASLIFDKPWTLTPSTAGMLGALFLALVSTALAFLIYFRLLRTIGSAGTLSVGYVRVGVAVLLGVILFGEPLTTAIVIGLVCVVAGVVMVTRKPT